METDTAPAEKSTRVKKYEPTDDDYVLASVQIGEAENGVVVSCRYALKDEIKDKMRANSAKMGDSCSFWEYENDEEKHVFNDKAEAKAFIVSELDAMWGDGVSGEDTE